MNPIRSLLSFLLCFVWLGHVQMSQAQIGTIILDIYVNDSSGASVSFQPLDITLSESDTSFSFSGTTDGTGRYISTLQFTRPDSGNITVLTQGCQGDADSIIFLFFDDSIQTFSDTLAISCGLNAGGNCSPDFSYAPIEPEAGDTITFQNLSPPSPTASYTWNFGDGTTDTTAGPTHIYQLSGNYPITLTRADPDSQCPPTDTLFIIPVDTGCAEFRIDSLNPNSYQFVPKDTSNPAIEYLWEFGDGTTSNQIAPIHTYTDTNIIYTVFLTASVGCASTTFQTVSPTGSGGPVCVADFTFDASNAPVVQFFDASQAAVTDSIVNRLWTFSTGDTSIAQSPIQSFPGPGPHEATLSILTGNGCFDSTTKVISFGPPCPVVATFSPVSNTGLTISFAAEPHDDARYYWDVNDGNGPQLGGETFVATFNPPDTLEVCLSVVDTLANCTSGVCQRYPFVSPCQANFLTSSLGNNAYQFTNLSNVSAAGATYQWAFGDGTTDTAANPQHQYNGAGPWTVTLSIDNPGTGCGDSVSQVIGNAPTTYTVAGTVVADSMSIFDGTAYLIQFDNATGILSLVDSTFIFGSAYIFNGVFPGDYLVKVALQPMSPLYPNYLPTYVGDEALWYDAIGTIVTNANVLNPAINLIMGTNSGGPGFIGGLVSQGANKTTGDPLNDVSVLLFTDQGIPVMSGLTDEEGHFEMEGLAYGTYHLYVDVINRYGDPAVITLSPTQPSVSNVVFEVSSTNITSNVKAPPVSQGLRVFPNPTQGELRIELVLRQTATVSLRLTDMMGQVVRHMNLSQRQGAVAERMNLSGLPAGVYSLEVLTGTQREIRRIRVE